MSNIKSVQIYTDGACSGNPGIGGWAAILIYGEHIKRVSGYDKHTTNNRMEVFSVIQGLTNLKIACDVTVYSDSAYLVNAFSEGWIEDWKSNGWKTSSKEEVKNQDLWKDLLRLIAKQHSVRFTKVKGHSDNAYNNECDAMAREQIKICESNMNNT